jgi:pyridoxal phosphate enzyme (YggS family)
MKRTWDSTVEAKIANFDENYPYVLEKLTQAAKTSGRGKEDIFLLAATKTVCPEVINHAIEKGLDYIGENRVQEMDSKWNDLKLGGIRADFIGHLQTNKARLVVGRVSMIQSLDSLRLAQAIDKLAKESGGVQQVLVEVNIGTETNKTGVGPEELESFLYSVRTLEWIKVKGLMAIPPICGETEKIKYFFNMHQLFIDMKTKKLDNVDMDFLSMGMSDDYEAAIREGANIVRIGSLLFGERQ